MALTGVAKRKVKKVQGKLKKASKAHAKQSKILGSLLKNGKKKKKRSRAKVGTGKKPKRFWQTLIYGRKP